MCKGIQLTCAFVFVNFWQIPLYFLNFESMNLLELLAKTILKIKGVKRITFMDVEFSETTQNQGMGKTSQMGEGGVNGKGRWWC